MRLIILSAGKGERIFDKIKINKPLIKIGNKSILENLIINAKKINIRKISIITGFKKNNIRKAVNKYKDLKFIHNYEYDNKDMLHSLIIGLKKYNESLLFSYSDIIFEKNLFKKFKKLKNNYIYIPYIKNWKKVWKNRKKSIYEDAETFSFDNKKFLVEIGNKIDKKTLVQGQFMGLVYIPQKLRKGLLNVYQDKFINRKLQTTQFLNFLIKLNFKVKCINYSGEWYEIDDYKDYKLLLKSNDFKRIKRDFKV